MAKSTDEPFVLGKDYSDLVWLVLPPTSPAWRDGRTPKEVELRVSACVYEPWFPVNGRVNVHEMLQSQLFHNSLDQMLLFSLPANSWCEEQILPGAAEVL